MLAPGFLLFGGNHLRPESVCVPGCLSVCLHVYLCAGMYVSVLLSHVVSTLPGAQPADSTFNMRNSVNLTSSGGDTAADDTEVEQEEPSKPQQ